jgi:hypothetical protein
MLLTTINVPKLHVKNNVNALVKLLNEGKKISNILNFFGANNTEAMDKIAKFKLNFLYFLSFSFLFRCGNNCNFGIDGCGRCVVSSISAAAGTCPGSNTGQPK